jgi:hypothetical protein
VFRGYVSYVSTTLPKQASESVKLEICLRACYDWINDIFCRYPQNTSASHLIDNKEIAKQLKKGNLSCISAARVIVHQPTSKLQVRHDLILECHESEFVVGICDSGDDIYDQESDSLS